MSKKKKKKNRLNQNSALSKKKSESNQKLLLRSERHEMFSGPIPPPTIFKGYEEILPGSADRILKMAENQSSHRQHLEKKVVSGSQLRAMVGLIFGFIIGMTVIVGGLIMIYYDKEWQGFVVGGSGLATLIGTFIFGNKEKKEDLTDKEKELEARVRELEVKRNAGPEIIDGDNLG